MRCAVTPERLHQHFEHSLLISRIQSRLQGSAIFLPSERVPGAFDKFLAGLIQFLNSVPALQSVIGDREIQKWPDQSSRRGREHCPRNRAFLP